MTRRSLTPRLVEATPGATAATRWVGGTASGAPASGTFAVGDAVVAQNGHVWICTVAGTPGTWVDAGSYGSGGSGIPASIVDVKGDLIVATAADVVARKAAGADGLLLKTDSAQSDGLLWSPDRGAWATTARVATSNLTLSGLYPIDGGAPVTAGTRVLLTGQTAPAENGIWVTSAGAWTRATDAATTAQFATGKIVHVTGNLSYSGTTWVYTGIDSPTIGTTALTFAEATGGSLSTRLMTTQGDMIYASGLTGGASRLGISALGTVLKSTGVAPSWDALRDSWIPVRLASTANLSLTGAATVDGGAVVTGDRVLAKDQSTPSQNGIYVANTAGAWTRATDADALGEFTAGKTVLVTAGIRSLNTIYIYTGVDFPTVGTTSLTFVSHANAGQLVVPTTGLNPTWATTVPAAFTVATVAPETVTFSAIANAIYEVTIQGHTSNTTASTSSILRLQKVVGGVTTSLDLPMRVDFPSVASRLTAYGMTVPVIGLAVGTTTIQIQWTPTAGTQTLEGTATDRRVIYVKYLGQVV